MYYASASILAAIHHLIINHEIIKNRKSLPKDGAYYKYTQFLISLMFFYVADMVWVFLLEIKTWHLAYVDTMFYFAAMAVSVLLWIRFVVAYLGKMGARSRLFLGLGWGICAFVFCSLIFNLFNPVIFSLEKDMTYVTYWGRYFLLGVQFLMFVAITINSLIALKRAEGSDVVHYRAICMSGLVMAVFVTLQMFTAYVPFYTFGCFLANCLVHVFIEEDEKRALSEFKATTQKEKERYTQIATGLASSYEAIYYIDIESGRYIEVSTSPRYDSMNVPKEGVDFYAETRANARKYAHPDDRAFAESMYHKSKMLKNLENKESYSYRYRVLVGDEYRYYRFVVMLSEDKKHFVLGDIDIQDTMTAQSQELDKNKTQVTFTQIAESLASNYDAIYYVDVKSGYYEGFTADDLYGDLKVARAGEDFFTDTMNNIMLIVHPQDREKMLESLDKDHLLSSIEGMKRIVLEYRLIIDDKVEHTRLIARNSSDGEHLIICVENIEKEVEKEKEHLKELQTEKELARRDELTGTKNKTAFAELEKSVQGNIEGGLDYLPFGFAVCDINDLKKVNDTQGHKAGDEYIKASAKLLCDTFVHSPVFRIGGDEFVIFLRSDDYTNRRKLVADLKKKILENQKTGQGSVIAIGTADYSPETDSSVNDVFERADEAMYENKRWLKGGDVR